MSYLKLLYSKESLKGKILRIEDDIKTLVKSVCSEKVWIFRYGAYNIDPKHLVFWIGVDTDKAKAQLASNTRLMSDLRELLIKYDYPEAARPFVHIGFESQETVDRESKGNWYHHFK